MADTKEKLIELIEQGNKCKENCVGDCDVCLADHLIAHGVTVQKWIPVTERLPDLEFVDAKADDFDLYACLVTVKNERARNGRYVGKAWYDGKIFMDSDCVNITYNITHWMPMPEPPKGE